MKMPKTLSLPFACAALFLVLMPETGLARRSGDGAMPGARRFSRSSSVPARLDRSRLRSSLKRRKSFSDFQPMKAIPKPPPVRRQASTGWRYDKAPGETSSSGIRPTGLRTWQEAKVSRSDAQRIQNAANRTHQTITVIGSRAAGTAGPKSDWDYVMSGNYSQRHSASTSVPRGEAGGALRGGWSGVDIFNTNRASPYSKKVKPDSPHVVFTPK